MSAQPQATVSPPPETGSKGDDKAVDIAVLCVHGIGNQRRGSTVASLTGSLTKSVKAALGNKAVTIVKRTPADRTGECIDVSYGGETRRVLAAESWWAQSFQPPSFGPLAKWLCLAGPFVIMRLVDGGMRRSTSGMKARSHKASSSGVVKTVGHAAAFVALGAQRLVQNVFAFLGALLLVAVLIALSTSKRGRKRLFAMAPAPTASVLEKLAERFVPSIQGAFIRSIGDSYALLHSKGARKRMRDQVCRDLKSLEEMLEETSPDAKIVIVAHSQGAELARQAVIERTKDPAKKDKLPSMITFGSGIEKLEAVRQLKEHRALAWSALGLRAVSAAALGFAAVIAAGGYSPPIAPGWLVAAGVGVAFAALAVARQALVKVVGAEYSEASLGVDEKHVESWLDLHASNDPVSEGALPLPNQWPSHEIVNYRSPIYDHTSYWRNVEQFHSAVALELARIGGWPAAQPLQTKLAAAADDRKDRVRWRVTAHAAIWISTLGAAAVLEAWKAIAIGAPLIGGAVALTMLASRIWDRWSRRRSARLLAGLRNAELAG